MVAAGYSGAVQQGLHLDSMALGNVYLEVVQAKRQGCGLGDKHRAHDRLARDIQSKRHIAETTTPNVYLLQQPGAPRSILINATLTTETQTSHQANLSHESLLIDHLVAELQQEPTC